MTLSTAQPALGGTPPELQPWYVSVAPQMRGGRAEGGMAILDEAAPTGTAKMMRKDRRCPPALPPPLLIRQPK